MYNLAIQQGELNRRQKNNQKEIATGKVNLNEII